jgi:Na+-driven multidrug efflux pump
MHIMTSKGGNYLLILTVGGTINLFLAFLSDGLLQALTVLISNARGRKDDLYIQKILRSSFIFILMIGVVLAIPLIIFPH